MVVQQTGVLNCLVDFGCGRGWLARQSRSSVTVDPHMKLKRSICRARMSSCSASSEFIVEAQPPPVPTANCFVLDVFDLRVALHDLRSHSSHSLLVLVRKFIGPLLFIFLIHRPLQEPRCNLANRQVLSFRLASQSSLGRARYPDVKDVFLNCTHCDCHDIATCYHLSSTFFKKTPTCLQADVCKDNHSQERVGNAKIGADLRVVNYIM